MFLEGEKGGKGGEGGGGGFLPGFLDESEEWGRWKDSMVEE